MNALARKGLRKAALVLTAAGLLVGSTGGTAAFASSPSPSYTLTELRNCVADPIGCDIAKNDAGPWAIGVSEAKYPAESLHNGPGDAFRHCIWAGAITQRIGKERAWRILDAHEAEGAPDSEAAMDNGNNVIGMAVGARANAEGGADTWGWIIDRCQTLEQHDRLYGLGYDPTTRA